MSDRFVPGVTGGGALGVPGDFLEFSKTRPSILPSGLGVQNPCPWEISQSSGMYFPIHPSSRQCTDTITTSHYYSSYEFWTIVKVLFENLNSYCLFFSKLVAAQVKISKAPIKGWKNQGCQKVTNGPKWWRQVCMRRSADSRGKLPTVPQTKAARSPALRGKKRDLQWSLAARCSSWSSYTIIHRFQSMHHLTKANQSQKMLPCDSELFYLEQLERFFCYRLLLLKQMRKFILTKRVLNKCQV